jgi:hypothetical protein
MGSPAALNCADRPLAYGVLFSSSLTLFPFALAATGHSLRFWTRAIIAFKFFLYVAWVSVSAFNPSCRSRLHRS